MDRKMRPCKIFKKSKRGEAEAKSIQRVGQTEEIEEDSKEVFECIMCFGSGKCNHVDGVYLSCGGLWRTLAPLESEADR